jgi:hypothetical protein
MAEETRQQRRTRQRELAKLGQAAFASGLPLNPSKDALLGVSLVLKAKLKERNNARRASEAIAMAHQLVERSLKAAPTRETIACKRGCSYCCYGYVGVLAPEVFRIADAVRLAGRQQASMSASAVRERCAPLIGKDPPSRMGAKLPCPLLVDNTCTTYLERPFVCRQTAAYEVQPCIEGFEGSDGLMRAPRRELAASSNAHVAMLAALKAAGLGIQGYELAGAVAKVVDDPGAEERWLAGDDVFAGLPTTFHRDPTITSIVNRIAVEIDG